MLVDPVRVAPGRIGLPDLDQRLRHRPSILVEHAPFDDDALAERLAGVLPRQVAVGMSHAPVRIHRTVSSDSVCGMTISGSFGCRSTVLPYPGRVVRRMIALFGSSEGHAGILYEAGHAAPCARAVSARNARSTSSSDCAQAPAFRSPCQRNGPATRLRRRPARADAGMQAGDRQLLASPGPAP